MNLADYVQQEYQTIDFRNYLVLRQKDILTPIPYCCKMIEHNQITGLLPMYTKQVNDQTSFYYDISGKVRLIDFLQRNVCSEAQGRAILLHIAEGLKNLSNYFLQQEFCILDLNYVFINDAMHVYFPVLPVQELLGQPVHVQAFFQKLVSQYFVTEENNPFYDGLLKYLVRTEFALDVLIQRLQPSKPQPVQSVSDVVLEAQPLRQPEPIPVKKPMPFVSAPAQQKEAAAAPAADAVVNGIKIPGAVPPAQPVKEKPKKEKKPLFGGGEKKPKKEKAEKKHQKGFHLFGAGEKQQTPVAENEPQGDAVPMPNNVSSASMAPVVPPVAPVYLDDATEMLEPAALNESTVYLMHQNRRVPIYKTPFVLGKLNADYLLDKSYISRVHATIIEKDGVYYIQDENSKNHTYLNGVQLAPYTLQRLENGSRIKLGLDELIFYQ